MEVYRALYSVIVGLGSHDMDVINENQELTFNMNSYPIISNQTLTDFPAHKVSNLVNTYCMESLKGSVQLMLLWYQSKHIFRFTKGFSCE